MTFGSLFSGIGGMDLGLERAGMECRWQVEIDPFCQKVLAKHWPGVKRYGDIRTVGEELERVDLIAGGFPCQDISQVNNQNGIGRKGISNGSRSGLWSEYFRIICLLRPKHVLIENVAALLFLDDSGSSPIGRVLTDLASIWFDAEWSVFRSCEVGTPHPRARVFILAYADGLRLEEATTKAALQPQADTGRHNGQHISSGGEALFCVESIERALVSEPEIVGVDNGLSRQVGRLRGLGNAVVPQVAEWIGRRIMEAHLRGTALGSVTEESD